jgi:hypothetical protein
MKNLCTQREIKDVNNKNAPYMSVSQRTQMKEYNAITVRVSYRVLAGLLAYQSKNMRMSVNYRVLGCCAYIILSARNARANVTTHTISNSPHHPTTLSAPFCSRRGIYSPSSNYSLSTLLFQTWNLHPVWSPLQSGKNGNASFAYYRSTLDILSL